ncbi:MaoC family dehydratase N-terminal domain-containing protein [Nonomuraea sp. NPDC046570]|uniref:FAS1-like dehydratase domain-containing protein n=1 Tax=Nonomuraea sp. NPDC046570 TaxID=3155255 RepID=UPI0033FAC3A0
MADARKAGYTWPSYVIRVERGKVVEFARALHFQNPIFHDLEAARAQGYADLPAPPTFSAVSQHYGPAQSLDDIGVDLRRVLAGGAEWEYLADVVAGDELTVTPRVAAIERKQGGRGTMDVITMESEFADEKGQPVLRLRTTILEILGEKA